jgi:UDP-glucose 4-epimerase
VEDIARANICALKSDATDAFYNVGRGIKTTIAELCQLLLELTESDLEIEYEPAGQTFVSHRVGCPKRARNELGFEAQTGLEDGLRSLIDWRDSHKGQAEVII